MVQDRIYNYFERNPQLHVLFIFDRMNIIQNELDEMKQWNDDYIRCLMGMWQMCFSPLIMDSSIMI